MFDFQSNKLKKISLLGPWASWYPLGLFVFQVVKVFFSLFLNVSLLVFFWNLSLDSQLSPLSLWAMSFFFGFCFVFFDVCAGK